MPNATVRANAQALPSRRAALGSLAVAAGAMFSASRVAKAASAAAEDDAKIIGLAAEIIRRSAEAEAFQKAYITIHEERFHAIGEDRSMNREARWEAAFAFSRDSGRDAAIHELAEFDEVTDRLFDRMMAVPATTQPGRAAKVRALLVHVMRTGWLGPADELDWDKAQARALLGEFAGLTADDLEAI